VPETTELKSIRLGFRAFDLHELLIHFIARELGYYRQNGLQVTLRDLTFLPDETLDPPFTAACGGALIGWTNGIRRKVVFVATDYPMFWLHARPEITEVRELKGRRIASYPAAAPPEQFHRAILRKHGLDPERDVVLEAARDDLARFGLLKAGDVDAAVISSAIPPPKVQSAGFQTLIFFGDEIRVPTTGLAVSEEWTQEQPEAVRGMTGALYNGIVALHRSSEKIIPILEQLLGESPRIAEQTYSLVSNLFTKDGRASAEAAQNAVQLVNKQLPPERKLRGNDIYDDSFLPG
jgi:ABC-type nitrate/sulfonate/bicarbonate transport system substrate-binding protein